MFKNQVLLITGGTGSFGNAVLDRFIASDVKEIRIFSRDEKKQEDMRLRYSNERIKFYVGDVRNFQSLSDAMRGVDYVFHAAALKQVPSCEFYPMEAMLTNVMGAENVINAANSYNVKKVIFLSTDKAVYPINAMGITKALMEKLVIAKSRLQQKGQPVLCCTRYGNVMASRGSVIPLFISQIQKNEPITITDPGMTRFLMSLEESVDLVLYAFSNGKQGDIFVQKSPASTIETLASAIQSLFNDQNSINLIGTRHGEKLYESLVSTEEMLRAVDEDKFYRVPADSRDLNYNNYTNQGQLSNQSLNEYNSHNTKRLTIEEVQLLLKSLPYVQKFLVS
jgi:UDP-N-acetylglucosamine 4,6-dehydratase/5-epimerase|tara:strand:- start:9581 stop:10591 length:1011 start_codon:yes stop_codon:yes gene_type:complete